MQVSRERRASPVSLVAGISRRVAIIGLATCLIALAMAAPALARDDETWRELRPDLFGEREILDGKGHLSLETPYRAHDAALVPVTIKLLAEQGPASAVKAVTLVIDENPAPVAAVFKMAPESSIAYLSTRVRVNDYSHVRAIAEMSDGKLYMVSNFVKASGGCSAPSSKNAELAIAQMGKMRLRQYANAGDQTPIREAQLQIRHPNHSGLQMDQVTGYYIPAHFVQTIDIRQGEKSILSIEGAISLSEDPSIRFRFKPNGQGKLKVRVEDTEDNVFEKAWDLAGPRAKGS